ncbi:MAG: sulfate reduction electron transfer complex DsrMKJOP subunit DsrJ [Deltaproteobacteria bacterium]|nr:sulfate reduction electron transfer complex DsrMKJOP subunit DsrJ [Deltaproteobacteria bacterium]MBW2017665.1 sulfate reduction electron transfer complex DsrMKJOP subunit DsrJ [Deltaproteobacteria bacterium]MBW2130260.1 sulfate reduction electron transfer complex DsrMKJOP subunit DsrJ [Deltaproteobacteria bacterium]MBW2302282.1 sulfate reduction electron transfer complex DsrMKJOP subunit DsrJ [Deltaproteobacteria bacterium]
MYDGGKIITGLIIGVGLLLLPFWYNAGKAAKAPDPRLTEKAKQAKICVAETSYMKTSHMHLLDRWRNEAVRDGDRYYKTAGGQVYYKSLQDTCMECHSNKSKFCDQCHNFMGVSPYCWDCHIAPKENN